VSVLGGVSLAAVIVSKHLNFKREHQKKPDTIVVSKKFYKIIAETFPLEFEAPPSSSDSIMGMDLIVSEKEIENMCFVCYKGYSQFAKVKVEAT